MVMINKKSLTYTTLKSKGMKVEIGSGHNRGSVFVTKGGKIIEGYTTKEAKQNRLVKSTPTPARKMQPQQQGSGFLGGIPMLGQQPQKSRRTNSLWGNL